MLNFRFRMEGSSETLDLVAADCVSQCWISGSPPALSSSTCPSQWKRSIQVPPLPVSSLQLNYIYQSASFVFLGNAINFFLLEIPKKLKARWWAGANMRLSGMDIWQTKKQNKKIPRLSFSYFSLYVFSREFCLFCW